MDLLKKVELLLSAKARSVLPRRARSSPLDEQEAEIVTEIRRALEEVEAEERKIAQRIKKELAQAEVASQQGDRNSQRIHKRRAAELDRHLEQESITAVNLEEKLRALEEKLALAEEAVEKQGKKAAQIDAEASKVLAEGGLEADAKARIEREAPDEKINPDDSADDPPDLAARKSRLSG